MTEIIGRLIFELEELHSSDDEKMQEWRNAIAKIGAE